MWPILVLNHKDLPSRSFYDTQVGGPLSLSPQCIEYRNLVAVSSHVSHFFLHTMSEEMHHQLMRYVFFSGRKTAVVEASHPQRVSVSSYDHDPRSIQPIGFKKMSGFSLEASGEWSCAKSRTTLTYTAKGPQNWRVRRLWGATLPETNI